MAPILQKLMDEIESQRLTTLASLQSYTDEQFNQSPSPGKWSAAEVLSHVITAERLSLVYLQKKIQAIDQVPRSGWWEEVKIFVLALSQRIPGIKYKAPKKVVENTTVLRSLREVETEWAQVRKDLRTLLDRIPNHQVDRMIYRHVVAGYLNTRHALIFFREHLIHHLPQLKRLTLQTLIQPV